MKQFECDIAPDDSPMPGSPRVRFNFANGWSASLAMRTGSRGMEAMLASVVACPTGQWGKGKSELGPTEAFADEAIAWLHEISQRPAL